MRQKEREREERDRERKKKRGRRERERVRERVRQKDVYPMSQTIDSQDKGVSRRRSVAEAQGNNGKRIMKKVTQQLI